MKKLGKPENGIINARNLTLAESKLLGIGRRYVITFSNNPDPGAISFWTRNDEATLTNADFSYKTAGDYTTKLIEFWNI